MIKKKKTNLPFMGIFSISILGMKMWPFKEIKSIAQGHIVNGISCIYFLKGIFVSLSQMEHQNNLL